MRIMRMLTHSFHALYHDCVIIYSMTDYLLQRIGLFKNKLLFRKKTNFIWLMISSDPDIARLPILSLHMTPPKLKTKE